MMSHPPSLFSLTASSGLEWGEVKRDSCHCDWSLNDDFGDLCFVGPLWRD
jgi:hypothetical protein